MINILVTVPELNMNGVSNVILQYLENLSGSEYSIDLLTKSVYPALKERLQHCNVNLILIDSRSNNPIRYFSQLYKICRGKKYDIIHAHGNSATLAVELFAAYVANIPIRIAHSHNTTCVHTNFDKLLRPIFYFSLTDGIACGLEAGKWMFRNRAHTVIQNGVDLEKFKFDKEKRSKVRLKYGISDTTLVIGHIGRFTYQKNHEYLLNIFEKLIHKNKDSVLLLVGEGPEENNIRRIAKEKCIEDKVIYFGTTDTPEILYSAMDVFLFPSRFEGVPLTLVEAQANGLTCVISDKISDEINVTPLVTMIKLTENPEKWLPYLEQSKNRHDMSLCALDLLDKSGFSINSVVKNLDVFYRNCVDRNKLS